MIINSKSHWLALATLLWLMLEGILSVNGREI
jgi:hypothetical protein